MFFLLSRHPGVLKITTLTALHSVKFISSITICVKLIYFFKRVSICVKCKVNQVWKASGVICLISGVGNGSLKAGSMFLLPNIDG